MDQDYTERLLQTVLPAATKEINDPQAVLHAAYNAIIQGNFEALGDSLADGVELNIHGFGPMDGNWQGRNNVIAATRRNFGLMVSQQPEIEGMICQGDSIAVLLRERGVLKSTGQVYSIRAVQWFTFADGKIKRIDEIAASLSGALLP